MSRLLSSVLLAASFLGACSTTATPSPEPTPEGIPGPRIVACIGVPAARCNAIVLLVSAALPPERGLPVSIAVSRGCDGAACDPDELTGSATVEWADGNVPMLFGLGGTIAVPKIDLQPVHWSGLVEPHSERVAPGAIVAFTLGHCGLTHVVDFDGSFWVPVGPLDPAAPEVINSAEGQMRLLEPNRAQFSSGGRLIATLARFPGPKHFFLCD